jgi:hypothetical protein
LLETGGSMTGKTRRSPTSPVPHATDAAAIDRVAELFEKMKSSPIGMSEPWESKPSGGKPLLYGGRRGLLAYGTIATWTEFDLIVAVINALPALLAAPVEIEPEIWSAVAGSVREQRSDRDGAWRSCSGCYETEDGQNVHGYPHSKVFGCVLGGGCSECGGIGAVWDATDYAAMAIEDQMRDAILSGAEQKAQAARCSCRGHDDLCACQNAPDHRTLSERRAAAQLTNSHRPAS